VQFGLAYGIANRTGQVSPAEAAEMVGLAATAGIDTIDTAIGYGDSEACLGEIGIEGFRVVTKLRALPADVGDVAGWVTEQVRGSLDRLGVASLHAVLLHRPADLLGPSGPALYDVLCTLKVQGLAERIGVSIYAPAELDRMPEGFRFDLVQSPFNLVDRRLLTSGWLARLKDDGVEVHARSAFLQGLLLMPRAAIPARFERWSELWDAWHHWLCGSPERAVGACLAFPLSVAGIDRVVVGADGTRQLRQILQAADELPEDLPNIASDEDALINPSKWTNV
jgi:hypothetical protein